MRILLIEDNLDVADNLQIGLELDDHTVDVVHDGLEGERQAKAARYDLLIVDWMLPGQDGPDLIRHLRDAGDVTPVLMLTARAEHADEISALEAGADDYLSKPFSFDVLQARLKALQRRSEQGAGEAGSSVDEAGPVQIDVRRRAASVHSVSLDLRAKEFELLSTFVAEPEAVLTRTELAERVWGSLYITDDVINTTISSLRRKLRRAQRETPEEAEATIKTVRGVGYCLTLPAMAAA